jgi:ABC-type dipeptide/oligopeptide/nickel transport system permease subunit
MDNPKIPTPLELAWRRFIRSRAGVIGGILLLWLYLTALFAGFLSPYAIDTQRQDQGYQPPQGIHLVHNGQWMRPFVYPMVRKRDPVTFQLKYSEDTSKPLLILVFTQGESYSFLGIPSSLHLFGVESGSSFFVFGSDQLGRDLYSRTLVGAQVSLTVGIIGILISFAIGIVVGGISGYYGGTIDTVLQRLVEVLLSFPRLPLLLALSAIILDWLGQPCSSGAGANALRKGSGLCFGGAGAGGFGHANYFAPCDAQPLELSGDHRNLGPTWLYFGRKCAVFFGGGHQRTDDFLGFAAEKCQQFRGTEPVPVAAAARNLHCGFGDGL